MTNNSPLKELDADYQKYKFSSLKYPENVESLSHLMMFNVNVNEFSKDIKGGKVSRSGDLTRQQVIRKDAGGLQANTKLGVDGSFDLGFDIKFEGKTSRKTVRTTTSIALYVPDTMVFDDTQNYENLSLTKELGPGVALAGALGATLGGGAGAIAGILGASAMKAIGAAIGGRAEKMGMGGIVTAAEKGLSLAAGLAGFSVNPMIEVIYRQPNLREFQFDFNFAPVSQKEATEVGNIIKQFRRHQAPEFNASSGIAGAAFLPPSEFDISFHRSTGSGFAENMNMPRISTCILKAVNTNYAPQMFATFKDGSSINITLRLAFMELDLMTRERIDQGF